MTLLAADSLRKVYSFLREVVPWPQVWPTQNSSFDQFKCSLGERCSLIKLRGVIQVPLVIVTVRTLVIIDHKHLLHRP